MNDRILNSIQNFVCLLFSIFTGGVKTDDFTETLLNPDKKDLFLKTSQLEYFLHFKNFDYYWVLSLITMGRDQNIFALKLPSLYIQQKKFENLNDLLKQIMNDIGIKYIDEKGTPETIAPGFDINKKTLCLHPKTYNDAWFFGCKDNNSSLIYSFIGIQKSKYYSLLKKYELDN